MKWNFSEQINPHFCERQFFIEVMNKLQSLNIFNDSFNFIITNYDDNTLPLYEEGKHNIVIYLSIVYPVLKFWVCLRIPLKFLVASVTIFKKDSRFGDT